MNKIGFFTKVGHLVGHNVHLNDRKDVYLINVGHLVGHDVQPKTIK
jgi:hypothetical protein